MDEDDDLEEWFDFSQSGDWERMIASIEQIFRDDEWNLVNTTCPNNVKGSPTKTFRFGDVATYSLSLHGSKGASPPEIDEASLSLAALWMMDKKSDFNIQVHEITRYEQYSLQSTRNEHTHTHKKQMVRSTRFSVVQNGDTSRLQQIHFEIRSETTSVIDMSSFEQC